MAVERRIDGESRRIPGQAEPASIGALINQLADDSRELVRQEINLAKLEMKESAGHIASNIARAAIWGGVAAVGGLALTAFLVIVIGNALGGAYWAGALIVGVVFLLVGGLLARSAMKKIARTGLKPDETIRSLKEDRRWLKHEARQFREDLAA